ncbi:MAG: cellulase N-terminal Ig-like domain-containing protein, partial [Bacteroidales bacterium]
MKRLLTLLVAITTLSLAYSQTQKSWIRINQAGYLPNDIKVAVMISLDKGADGNFRVFDALSDKLVFEGEGKEVSAKEWGMEKAYRMDISSIEKEGGYYIESNGIKSPVFKIAADA